MSIRWLLSSRLGRKSQLQPPTTQPTTDKQTAKARKGVGFCMQSQTRSPTKDPDGGAGWMLACLLPLLCLTDGWIDGLSCHAMPIHAPLRCSFWRPILRVPCPMSHVPFQRHDRMLPVNLSASDLPVHLSTRPWPASLSGSAPSSGPTVARTAPVEIHRQPPFLSARSFSLLGTTTTTTTRGEAYFIPRARHPGTLQFDAAWAPALCTSGSSIITC